MVGDDGAANKIGVAPQAKWMSCRACAGPLCSFFGLLDCGQFMLAPWNLAEQNPNPDLRPHVVNNSWALAFGGFAIFQTMVRNWRAAGIFPAFAAGNSGPACNTANSPGDYPEAFATGASNSVDAIADFSSRGPSAFAGIIKPDASAPGVSIRSSVPTNSYATFSGTSMASPHTAGLVALLWSYYPGLLRDIDSTEKKLRPAAAILNTTQGCGGDGATAHPNNVFGWGRHDAVPAIASINIYTDRSIYTSGETAVIQVSIVSPLATEWQLDLHLGVIFPGGSTMTSKPITVSPLGEFFDIPHGTYTWGAEPAGEYTWFAILTERGADPSVPSNHLSGDVARVIKQ
jgi:subtilisin family serine protease